MRHLVSISYLQRKNTHSCINICLWCIMTCFFRRLKSRYSATPLVSLTWTKRPVHANRMFDPWCHMVTSNHDNISTINSLVPGKYRWDFRNEIFFLGFLIDICRFCYDDALIGVSDGIIDDKSTLVQVMAWYHQATSHYLSQFWPRS